MRFLAALAFTWAVMGLLFLLGVSTTAGAVIMFFVGMAAGVAFRVGLPWR
jgi:hypothetical protein